MSVIKVNTIQNANGTTALVIAANGQLSRVNTAIISDGTYSTSANNVIQGSAKAWVNFNGTGTVAIRGSYNVSSITDNGAGDYTVNFTTAMPNANYVVQVGAPMYITTNGSVVARVYGSGSTGSPGLQSTTQIRVCWADIGAPTNFYDPETYYVSVFSS
jgi:hypothetical protein